ncbi:hypothetical protein AVEN_171717-1, partial [Araneus ventricosus]
MHPTCRCNCQYRYDLNAKFNND